MCVLVASDTNPITLNDDTAASTGSGIQTATYTIGNDGFVKRNGINAYQWLAAGRAAADYDVFATLSVGSLFSGTTGAWLNLATSRSWSVRQNSAIGEPELAAIDVQIRSVVSGVTLGHAFINLSAYRTS